MPLIKLKTQNSKLKIWRLEFGVWKLRKGFTLIEILVVIGIIGILAGTTTVSFSRSQVKTRDSQRKNDLQTIKSALNLYFQQNQKYPPAASGGGVPNDYTSFNGLTPWITDLTSQYIANLPKDPSQTASNFFQNMLASIENFKLVGTVLAGGGGGGCASQAAAFAAYNTATHTIDGVSMLCYGSGYSVAPYVVFTGCSDGSTVQATATAHLGGVAPPDGVGSITMDTPGSGYTCTPTVNIGPPPGTALPPPPPPPPGPTPYATPAPATGCIVASPPTQFFYCYSVNDARTRFKLWARLENTTDPELASNSSAPCFDAGFRPLLNYCVDSD